ncbi:MAG: alpha/beta fold hydrolase [Phycisphaerales bacterium]|nr:alpha/beta fold hydrolase [Phycisphaerales bacterium]
MNGCHFECGAPRPLVLIHGFLGAPCDWDPLRLAMTAHVADERVSFITIDLLEVARLIAEGPVGSRQLGLSDLAAQIARQLDADPRTQGGFDVLGYSLGGRIALEMMAHVSASEAVSARTAPRFVLVSAHPGLEDSSLRAARAIADDRIAGLLKEIGAAREPTRSELARAFLLDWYASEMFAPLRARLDFSQVLARRTADLAHADASLLWADIVSACSPGRATSRWRELESRASDSSFIVGSRDARYLAAADEARAIGVRTRCIPDAGHAVLLEQPGRLATEVLHLRECQPI